MTQQETPNPLFAGFTPQPLGSEQTQAKAPAKVKKPRKPKAAKVAKAEPAPAKVKKPRKPKAAKAIQPVVPAVQNNLQAVFAAVRGLEDEDYPLFEKLLAASPATRKRVFVALAKVFP